MHTRGLSKKLAKDQETEENRGEEEEGTSVEEVETRLTPAELSRTMEGINLSNIMEMLQEALKKQ